MKSKNRNQLRTVGFVALGCPKNIVDSERMLAEIGQGGFVIGADPDNADVVIINTCGFIAPAKAEAMQAITHALAQKKKARVGKVIVCGCLSQRMGTALAEEAPGIDAVVGLGCRDNISDIIGDIIAPAAGRKSGCVFYLDEKEKAPLDDRTRLLITPAHWAYLRISEGCDRKCSFCTIPSIRGRFRSKDEDAVIGEARELVEHGAVELSIIAQDSNYYLRDRGVKNGLSKLLGKLVAIDGLQWIRLMYLYPATIDEDLIETIAQHDKVLNYIDMPIQHINDDILKAMRRSDRKDKTMRLIEKLRSAMPDVVLRTTIIAGFPGETDDAFAELLDFVRWAKFDALGCFAFCPEVGTAAAELADQVPDDIRHARGETLMLTQQEIAFAAARRRIGSRLRCLVDEVEGDAAVGRFYGQAPHIDSICHITDCKAGPGQFVQTKVIDTDDYDFVVTADLGIEKSAQGR
ncbi:MAG: 30S ribosomal protein S12 methylthiotransferase RimO [Planctomycetes bacterium]|nr:30S ribosomal protein S12 methylthiotransferase RimO [Planctomycetota bacterium]